MTSRPSHIRTITVGNRSYYIDVNKIVLYRMDTSNSQLLLWMTGIPEHWSINCTVEEFEQAMYGELK